MGRAVDYLSFYRSADRVMRKLLKPGDILVAMTDPPLSSILGMRVARRKGAHLVNWLQDIYPEIAVELGVPVSKRAQSLPALVIGAIARSNQPRSTSSWDKPWPINWPIAASLPTGSKSSTIGPMTVQIIPVSHPDNRLRRLWGLDGKFVVGYSGNLGRAHEFDTILAASEALRNDPRIVFLFIGSGHRLDELGRDGQIARPRDQLPLRSLSGSRPCCRQSLGVPDLHWVSLKPALEGLIVPSKFYGIAAAGRPTLAITSLHGEIAKLVRDFDCGLVIEPGNSELLSVSIRQLSDSPEQLERMGRNARAMLDAHFTRDQAYRRWLAVLNEVNSSVSLKVTAA